MIKVDPVELSPEEFDKYVLMAVTFRSMTAQDAWKRFSKHMSQFIVPESAFNAWNVSIKRHIQSGRIVLHHNSKTISKAPYVMA